jgi:hypothetical protein
MAFLLHQLLVFGYQLLNKTSSNFLTFPFNVLLSELLKSVGPHICIPLCLTENSPLLIPLEVHKQGISNYDSHLKLTPDGKNTLGKGCNNIANIFFRTSCRIASIDKSAAYLPVRDLRLGNTFEHKQVVSSHSPI